MAKAKQSFLFRLPNLCEADLERIREISLPWEQGIVIISSKHRKEVLAILERHFFYNII